MLTFARRPLLIGAMLALVGSGLVASGARAANAPVDDPGPSAYLPPLPPPPPPPVALHSLPRHPGAASHSAGPGVRVPILMYHYIRTNPAVPDRLGADLSIAPAHFAAQLDWLAAHGFQTITLDDLTAAIRHGAPLPRRPVILTFDDGYADFYTAAYPALAQHGFKATSFVITGKVGRPGYLTWDQMRAMQASGLVQFEAHTVDHVELAHVSLLKAQYELIASKQALESQLGTRVKYFCYPSGDYNAAVEALVTLDGYQAALTTHPGLWHHPGDLLALTRVRIHGSDTLARFAAHLGLAPPPALHHPAAGPAPDGGAPAADPPIPDLSNPPAEPVMTPRRYPAHAPRAP
ncbi:MAG TPA: polysaccharide deacetylase family protein [Chloroflexia bacterium]|nr:polysaccharide deacetylase family protein [Chloroflexia bacterium]